MDSIPGGGKVSEAAEKRGPGQVALVLSGGIALGAYEAGAYAALAGDSAHAPTWLSACSIGAVNAALIAGSPPGESVDALRRFWAASGQAAPLLPIAWAGAGIWRDWANQQAAWQTLAFGRPGLFRPRLAPGLHAGAGDVPAVFDLAPLGPTLETLVDWDRLNDGATRVALCCTDVLSGERVVFDTGCGDRIGAAHVLASSALMPLFAPVELDGRLLADGALSGNAPLDPVLDRAGDAALLCLVVELFGRAGQRPHTLAAAASRAADLAFGNQTRRILDGRAREHRLEAALGRLSALLPPAVQADPAIAAELAPGRTHPATIAMVAYRAGLDEAGLLKPFDFSPATLADRWAAGEATMRAALARLDGLDSGEGGLRIVDC